jgi:catechol 2,3-dioxygenase-like lactoylglutathione lyase family enzyme
VISGFDHVVIGVRDLVGATTTYETLLGRNTVQQGTRDGVARSLIALDNIAVELIAPDDGGEGAERLSAALEDGEGLKSLVFATLDIERTHTRCERVGLAPGPIMRRGDGAPASFRTNTERTHGVRVFLIESNPVLEPSKRTSDSVLALDHVVIRSPNMERAAALYGARLGLDMRLDREVRGHRLMFFRCGDAIVEIAHDPARDTDLFWGLSWRVANADAARERLASAGVNVSEVRAGAKPGTRVFTVRDGACNVPTLMIEQPRRAPR